MLYDWTSTAALGVVRDIQPKEPLTLTGEGLWVCLISSGRCTASLTDASLLHREYTLDVIASLCGFSGANYLCRVFKKETGQSPAQWRALAGQTARPLSPAESQREQALYI